MPLRHDEISEVQEIARLIAKQEIAEAIKDLQKEDKPEPEAEAEKEVVEAEEE